MELEFSNQMIEWRGPAPFYYVPVPAEQSALIRETARQVSYGWGVILVSILIVLLVSTKSAKAYFTQAA